MFRVLIILLPVAVTIYALIDAITTPRNEVRGLPKWGWILLIAVVWVVGAVIWLVFGRLRLEELRWRSGGPGGNSGNSQNIRPLGPDDDPDFLRNLDRRKPKSDKSGDKDTSGD